MNATEEKKKEVSFSAKKIEDPKEIEERINQREKLISQAETLSSSTEWKTTAEKLQHLNDEWKKLGPLPKDKADELWNRFYQAKQVFFDNRQKYFEKMEDERRDNLKKKEELCKLAENLSNSTDWKNTAEKFKHMDEEWKKIGQVPKEDSDYVWNRFYNAKQNFFENRRKHFENLDKERQLNLEKKEQLCAEAENLSDSTEWKETGEKFKQLQAEWKSIGPVPKENADTLWQRFNSAAQNFYDNRSRFFEEKDKERERKHSEWKERMTDTIDRLEKSIQDDEAKIREIENKFFSIKPGRREEEIKSGLRDRIDQIQEKIDSKRTKLNDIRSKM